MKIEILGTGCSKCEALTNNVKAAIAKKGIFAQVEKVDDMIKIMEYGVMSTPGLVIDGEVKSTGKVLTAQEIEEFLK
ncbi:thioredoxin family protein [Halarcobacter sp.]|uniref:thioredoxin family protein n=1 Tax=Halarcobacter sp. TaxID=2321133 RepID=UPI0029F4B3F3|nr:thioredoxin family protein [Halarcobacter sp.]